MNVLVEIGHPAHVHFFSGAILRLKAKGHQVRIVTRNKEITDELLRRQGFPFQSLSRPARSPLGLAFELLSRWARIIALLLKERIDVAVSISGISTSFPAWLTRTPNLLFTDTEDATLSNRLAFPFADRILTPAFYRGELGPRHLRYEALHELAYLRDFDFTAARGIRARLGLPEKYALIRIVKLDALHDQDVTGIDERRLKLLVAKLAGYGEVYLSSGVALSPELEGLRLKVPLETMHAVMAGCRVFVGESPTMAVESSLLGCPAFLVTPRFERLGNMVRLQQAGLLRCYSDWDGFLDRADAEIEGEDPAAWQARAGAFRRASTDVSRLIEDSILAAGGGRRA